MMRIVIVALSSFLASTAWSGDPPAANPAANPAAAPAAVQVDKAHYAVTVTAPAGAAAQIALAPRGGFKLNKAYPTKISLKAGDGVTLPKSTLSKPDAVRLDEKGASFPVAYTVGDAGGQVDATVKFSVCSAETCEMVKEKVSWKVVKAAAAP